MCHKRFEEISISDLCDNIGIPRKAFYRYFSSKDGALFALLDHTLMDFYHSAPFGSTRGGTPTADLERFFLFWYENKPLLDALHKSSLSGLLVERATLLARDEMLMTGYLKKWDDSLKDIAIAFAVCGLLTMVFQWHRDGFLIEPEDMARTATVLLTSPLMPV